MKKLFVLLCALVSFLPCIECNDPITLTPTQEAYLKPLFGGKTPPQEILQKLQKVWGGAIPQTDEELVTAICFNQTPTPELVNQMKIMFDEKTPSPQELAKTLTKLAQTAVENDHEKDDDESRFEALLQTLQPTHPATPEDFEKIKLATTILLRLFQLDTLHVKPSQQESDGQLLYLKNKAGLSAQLQVAVAKTEGMHRALARLIATDDTDPYSNTSQCSDHPLISLQAIPANIAKLLRGPLRQNNKIAYTVKQSDEDADSIEVTFTTDGAAATEPEHMARFHNEFVRCMHATPAFSTYAQEQPISAELHNTCSYTGCWRHGKIHIKKQYLKLLLQSYNIATVETSDADDESLTLVPVQVATKLQKAAEEMMHKKNHQ